MKTYTMTIDGQQVGGSDGTYPVINPATEEVLAEAPACSAAQLDEAVAAAQRAFPAWKKDEGARRKALADCAAALFAEAQEIGKTLTLEQGKPLAHAMGEVMGAAKRLKDCAEQKLPDRVLKDTEKGRLEIQFKPLGVVAGITPWNFPVMIAMTKIAPALLAGNTVVLKPSEYTPLSTLEIGTVMSRHFPPGVINVVSGEGKIGAQLSGHPGVRKVSFTGSVATGRRVAEAGASDLKRVTLELGGNDPAVVLDDADPAQIAGSLFWSAFTNSGQICIAVKRLYVPENLYDPMVRTLSAMAEKVKVGPGIEQGTEMGPVNNAMQFDRVNSLIADAKNKGAEFTAGGESPEGKGYFIKPSIATGIDESVDLVGEEQFGPALPVMPYKDVDEVLQRANSTSYGLGASVWSSNEERALEVAAELEAGTVWVNQHLVLSQEAPFGGAKNSGIGLAGGEWGLEDVMQLQVVNLRR